MTFILLCFIPRMFLTSAIGHRHVHWSTIINHVGF